jgi:drug/metabolite transporter (DMT)-like permease
MNYNIAIVMFIISAFLSAVSQLMLKKSAMKEYSKWHKAYLNPLVIPAYAVLFITTLINMQAYIWVSFRLGAILSTTAYIFILILSRFVLKEKITLMKMGGIALILVGIFVFIFSPVQS